MSNTLITKSNLKLVLEKDKQIKNAAKDALAANYNKIEAVEAAGENNVFSSVATDVEAYELDMQENSFSKVVKVNSIGGKSVVLNQLIDQANARKANGTYTVNADGSIHAVYNGTGRYKKIVTEGLKVVGGHMYMVMLDNANTNIQYYLTNVSGGSSGFILNSVSSATSDSDIYLRMLSSMSIGVVDDFNYWAVDLTKMFGAGNEPTTVEQAYEMGVPRDYIPYNAGEIVSADVNNIIASGVNIEPVSHPIPQAIRDLPGYGWSAGSVYNEVDYKNKQYIQRVDKVVFDDSSTIAAVATSSTNVNYVSFYTIIRQKPNSINLINNYGDEAIANSAPTKSGYIRALKDKFVRYDDTYINIDTVKKLLSEKPLVIYYELEEPIVTDISDLIHDDLRDLPIIPNGKLTFAQLNNTQIPVRANLDWRNNFKKIDLKAAIDEVSTLSASNNQKTFELKDRISLLENFIDKPTSWADVQKIVRAGLARNYFEIGDEFIVPHEIMCDSRWVIRHFDYDPLGTELVNGKHNMLIELKTAYGTPNASYTAIQYDQREAFYYAENGLDAGTYNFHIQEVYNNWTVGDYQFTLTSAVPAGGQLVFNGDGSAALTSRSVQVFTSGASASAIQTVPITAGNAGTFLGNTGINQSKCDVGFNSLHRASFGSNNYAQSAVRQWLNSDSAAGSVWTQQTVFDRIASWGADTSVKYQGFKRGFSNDFLQAVISQSIPCRTNSIFETNSYTINSVYNIHDTFFLLSRPEIYGSYDISDYKDGARLEYYTGLTDADHILYDDIGTARHKLLRSPNYGTASSTRVVNATTGAIGSYGASNAIGVAPACLIG